MKNAVLKNALREIKNSRGRFLSFFGITALGVGFFAGITASAPDMRYSADNYYERLNLADFRLVSTFGFDDNDIDALKEVGFNKKIYPAYFSDVILHNDNSESVVRVMSLPEKGNSLPLNKLELTEGRMPEKADECVIDARRYSSTSLIGQEITLKSGDKDGDISDVLSNDVFTVVGVCHTPLYPSDASRGYTTVGSGNISFALFIPESNFKQEVYTEVYIQADRLRNYNCYTDDYRDEAEILKEVMEKTGEARRSERLNEIKADAEEEIAEAVAELEDKKREVYAELDDAKAQLDDAKKQLDEAKAQTDDGEQKLKDALAELEDGRRELDNAWVEYYNGIEEFEQGIADGEAETEAAQQALVQGEEEYEQGLAAYTQGLAEIEAAYALLEEGYAQLEEGYAALEQAEAIYGGIPDTAETIETPEPSEIPEPVEVPETGGAPALNEIAEKRAELDAQKALLDAQKELLDSQAEILAAAGLELEAARKRLDEGWAELEEGEKALKAAKLAGERELEEALTAISLAEDALIEGRAAYESGRRELDEGITEYEQGLSDYEQGLADYDKGEREAREQFADAQAEIDKAKRDLAKLDKPIWYIYNRDSFPNYTEYGQNAERIASIAKAFPVFFLLVAALVCSASVSRMVEEQRGQVGVFKALGYGNASVLFKYLLYAISATILGCAAGLLFGMKLFPYVIITAYQMMYNFPDVVTPYDINLSVISLAAAAGLIALVVVLSVIGELMEKPARLMRPKAPRKGKRVFLEKIGFIWKRLSFSSKVSVRNIFRYKRRMLMTVVGIAGCTALTFTGFALKDSVTDITRAQFGKVTLYSGFSLLNPDNSATDKQRAEEIFTEYGCELLYIYEKAMLCENGQKSVELIISVVRDAENLGDYFLMRSRTTGEEYDLSVSGTLITEKAAKLLGIEQGDEIVLSKSETDKVKVTISGITENYAYHYLRMTEEVYYEAFGERPVYDTAYFKGIAPEKHDEMAKRLLDENLVLGTEFLNNISGEFDEMTQVLNLVILVLIISAGILSFIVLYNLTNININERIREIATLKVLGFFDSEVDMYIFRENFILTLMGTAAGLVGGIFLSRFVIETAEVDMVMFGREIYFTSYLWATVMTVLFSVVVPIIMHAYLKKINMAESLKSID